LSYLTLLKGPCPSVCKGFRFASINCASWGWLALANFTPLFFLQVWKQARLLPTKKYQKTGEKGSNAVNKEGSGEFRACD
jgi:hypothetical protein